MIKGNKGEWSEIYVLLKLLGDGGIYAADGNLKKISSVYYPLIEILRKEKKQTEKRYLYDDSNQCINILESSSGEILLRLPINEFKEKSTLLLKEINKIKKVKGTFAIEEIENFMQSIQCFCLKAPSQDKRDITIVLHDTNTCRNETFGFSIKSKLGNPSTLLNAGKTTNFIYEIIGDLSSDDINEINLINTNSKIIDRVNTIFSKNCSLNFIETENLNFYLNLSIIDTSMPEILANLLVYFYKKDDEVRAKSVKDLIQKLNQINPCNFNMTLKHPFYEYKLKNFLTDVALGMKPSKTWSGKIDATGGYIVVRKDGEIVCYHFYRKNEFQNYLINNTQLDSPDMKKYDFGKIYSKNGKNYIKLNLQVRFM